MEATVQLLNDLLARLSKRRYWTKEVLFHNTLGLTIAASNSVAWLVANKNRHKADHSVHTIEEFGDVLKRGSTLFRADANLHPNKITDPEAILSHAERTY